MLRTATDNVHPRLDKMVERWAEDRYIVGLGMAGTDTVGLYIADTPLVCPN